MPEVTIRLSDQQLEQLDWERAEAGVASLADYLELKLCGSSPVAAPAPSGADPLGLVVPANDLPPIQVDAELQAIIDAAEADPSSEEWTPEYRERLLAECRRLAGIQPGDGGT